MTKQEKREMMLQKEIKILERNNFALQRENDKLKYEIRLLTSRNRTLNESLSVEIRRAGQAEEKRQQIYNEVQKYLRHDKNFKEVQYYKRT